MRGNLIAAISWRVPADSMAHVGERGGNTTANSISALGRCTIASVQLQRKTSSTLIYGVLIHVPAEHLHLHSTKVVDFASVSRSVAAFKWISLSTSQPHCRPHSRHLELQVKDKYQPLSVSILSSLLFCPLPASSVDTHHTGHPTITFTPSTPTNPRISIPAAPRQSLIRRLQPVSPIDHPIFWG